MSNPSIFSQVPAPLITSSANLDNNTTVTYKLNDAVYVDSLTDGVATLEGGFLKNLNDPVTDDQAATKNFVDNFVGVGVPGGNDTNIQLNDGANDFTGTNDLTFDNGTGNTFVNGSITNGTITIQNNQISGVADPVNAQDVATKGYVDAITSQLTDVTVETGIGFSITEQVITYSQLNNTLLTVDFII